MMIKEELINYLQNDVFCRIFPSSINGVGLFAIRFIPKQTYLFKKSKEYPRIEISEDEINKLPSEVSKMIKSYFAKKGDFYRIFPWGLDILDIRFFLNHSNNPNLDTINYFALRDIQKGEEITIDYKKLKDIHPNERRLK